MAREKELEIAESGLWSGLWVLATPIGNLSDLSERAKSALKLCDFVLCEDTRRTSTLVAALGLRPSLYRFDAHASESEIEKWTEALKEGKRVALVSDAGTPGVSDPGARLVASAWKAGIRVVPVPGVSAVTALVSVSGWELQGFSFRGFFPRSGSEREAEKAVIEKEATLRPGQGIFWFESPERLQSTVEFLTAAFPGAQFVAGKEMTKRFEKIFLGNQEPPSFIKQIQDEISNAGPKGEWCLGLRLETGASSSRGLEEDENSLGSAWVKALQACIDAGATTSRAAKSVSQVFGVSKKLVYDRALEINSKKTPEGG